MGRGGGGGEEGRGEEGNHYWMVPKRFWNTIFFMIPSWQMALMIDVNAYFIWVVLPNHPCTICPVEFHQHMVLAYAENFFVISSYLWPPESKSEWSKCVHVERSEIWVKKCIFWSKTFFSMIRIDNNFLIIISGDSTTYLLLSVYFKSKMWIFSIFG